MTSPQRRRHSTAGGVAVAGLCAAAGDRRRHPVPDAALRLDTRDRSWRRCRGAPKKKQAFLASQFQAQRQHYRNTIEGCAFDIIEHRGQPAGRLYLDVRQTQLHIVDIALLPEWRGQASARRSWKR